MARRDRSYSPDVPNKRVRPHRSPRSPSPTRRSSQRPPRSRYDDDRERERPRDRDRDRDRDGYRDRDRHRDDRFRDDKRRDGYRDDRRDDRDRRRSRSRDRRDRPLPPPATNTPAPAPPEKGADGATPPVEDEKLKAKKAKLEAWKKEREAKKALGEAKAKAMALAGKTAPGTHISRPITICMISQHLIFYRRQCCCNKERPAEPLSLWWLGSQRLTHQTRCPQEGRTRRLRRDQVPSSRQVRRHARGGHDYARHTGHR